MTETPREADDTELPPEERWPDRDDPLKANPSFGADEAERLRQSYTYERTPVFTLRRVLVVLIVVAALAVAGWFVWTSFFA